jgi:hypothetical protein
MNSAVATQSHPASVDVAAQAVVPRRQDAPRRIPLRRIVSVELRKSFDTRAGFWLLASILGASLLTTGTVILFAPAEEFTYSTFTMAIAFPMSVILPMIAVLSVTAEWTQRSGLTTFTLVPHRSRVLLAKAVAVTLVAPVATLLAFTVGALGNLLGTAVAGTPVVWDRGITDAFYMVLADVLLILVGFTFGVLIRNTPGAIVGYFVYGFVTPGLLTLLAMSQKWFHDLQPWVDPNYSQDALLEGSFAADQWAQLAVTSGTWLVTPLAIGLVLVTRAEVK